MNTCDTLLDTFCDRVMGRISDSMCEDGPFVVIIDDSGNWRSSDAERFGEVFDRPAVLKGIVSMVADGGDPITACVNGCGVVAGQLASGGVHRGYIVIGLCGYSIESTVANVGLAETLLNQINVIASLIDGDNNLGQGQCEYAGAKVLGTSFCVN